MTVEHRATLWMQQGRNESVLGRRQTNRLSSSTSLRSSQALERQGENDQERGDAFRCEGHGFIARFVPDVALSGWNNLVSFDAG